MLFADRLRHVETSAIRELFKLLGNPGVITAIVPAPGMV